MKKKYIGILLFFALLISSCSKDSSVTEFKPPVFQGIAYIQGSGDHIVALNLNDGDVGRIIHGKKSVTFNLSQDRTRLYIFSKDGYVKSITLATGQQSEWKRITESICDSAAGTDGNIWLIDRSMSLMVSYNPLNGEILKKISVDKGVCSITFSPDGETVYLVNNDSNSVSLLSAKNDYKLMDRIQNAGNSIHRAKLAPYGPDLWVAEGNEFKDGKPYGVGYAKTEAIPGGINVLNLTTKKVEDFILVGGNSMDLQFSTDGKYAFVVSSQLPEYDEATLSVIDVSTRRVIKHYSLCKRCHVWKGIELPNNKAFVFKVQIDPSGNKFGAAVKPE